VGVVKHMPGHGRARVDSHKELPVVDAPDEALALDLEPFTTLKGAPMGMVAHIIFSTWDAERPSSQSPIVIEDIIRGRIGFDGFLMTDDLGMEALSGDFAERARRALDAGCDAVVHCSGVMEEMVDVASAAGPLSEKALERLDRAMAQAGQPAGSYAALAEKRDKLLAYAED
jgi:beta-N-acetylhexosaminidase